MSKIDKETMLELSDKVLTEYVKNFSDDTRNNDDLNALFNHVSDIAAMVVLEYHKLICEDSK